MIAVPPGTKQEVFLEILLDLETKNTHGFGLGYVENGGFKVRKTALSLSETLKKRKDFFDGIFPNKSWVLGHCRYATRGEICARNSHPFESNKYLVTHNGTFKEQNLVKFLMGKTISCKSETDSEVALKLLEKVGPKRFLQLTYEPGVFLALEKSGRLWAIKSEFKDDLKIGKIGKDKFILASRFSWNNNKYRDEEAKKGWYLFDANGGLIASKTKGYEYESSSNLGNQGNHFGSVRSKLLNTELARWEALHGAREQSEDLYTGY